jgi:hypothetical protein
MSSLRDQLTAALTGTRLTVDRIGQQGGEDTAVLRYPADAADVIADWIDERAQPGDPEAAAIQVIVTALGALGAGPCDDEPRDAVRRVLAYVTSRYGCNP